MHQKHGQSDGRGEKAEIHRRMKSCKGIVLHLHPSSNKKWSWRVTNEHTITIFGTYSPGHSRSPDSHLRRTGLCLLRVSPNDWLSPTNPILDAYGIG